MQGHKDATIMIGGSFLDSVDGAKLSVEFHYSTRNTRMQEAFAGIVGVLMGTECLNSIFPLHILL